MFNSLRIMLKEFLTLGQATHYVSHYMYLIMYLIMYDCLVEWLLDCQWFETYVGGSRIMGQVSRDKKF